MKVDVLLNRVLLFSLIIFFMALGFSIYFLFLKPTPITELKINLIGPNEVNSLEVYPYTLSIENNSNQRLTQLNLKIFLSEGAFLKDRVKEKEISFSLGDLEARSSYKQNLEFFFINEGGLRENLKFVLSYKIENKNYVFEKEENFFVLVKNPPIKIQIYLPNKVYVNQEFQTTFRITNLTQEKLNNLKVILETPTNYLLTSVFPKSENFYFEYPSLNPEETKDIVLIGQIQSKESNSIFSAKLSFDFLNYNFSLAKEVAKVNLLENPIVFTIRTTPANKSVPIGSSIYYEVILENRSQTLLEDNEVRVTFNGPFDLTSLNSDGYFSQLDQVLYWNSRNKTELLSLKPGDKVKFNFSLSLLRSYPILSEKSKDFTAKMRIEFRSKSIPIEIEAGGKEYVVYQEDEKKIMGNIEINQELVYNDEYFPGTGPFPLQANLPTSLAWHIKIKTIGEDFENFSLNTRLPIGVNLTGKVAGDALAENLKFDPKTGAFVYTLNKLPANLGYLTKEMELVFQIIVTPPANVYLPNFMVIPQIQYSAIGSFSGVQISNNLREIYSSQIK